MSGLTEKLSERSVTSDFAFMLGLPHSLRMSRERTPKTDAGTNCSEHVLKCQA